MAAMRGFRLLSSFALVVAGLLLGSALGHRAGRPPLVATFSIVGFDAATGDLGVAVQSKFPNVRAVVPWAKAGVGAVATQSFAELDYGMNGLALLERGATAAEALETVKRGDPGREQRQVGIVDAQGNAATFTGKDCFPWAGGKTGPGYAVQGNILVGKETIDAMARAFESAHGELAERLLAALVAGGKAGGDRRGEQSAALLVVRKGAGYDGQDNFVDLSVYDHATPIAELVRLEKLNRLHFRGSKPENLVPVTPAIARELQEIWTKRGFRSGAADGKVDAAFQKTLVDFLGWENYDTRIEPVQKVDLAKGETLVLDREVLDDIRRVFASGAWKLRTPDPR
jgi:uncharacterized Ntn-hydrolase superfamily protein